MTGWIIRLAVQAAVPALAKVCAKGVAKAGKSVFKFRGKDYDVKVDKPLTTKRDREPSATPTRAPENTNRPPSSSREMPARTKFVYKEGTHNSDFKDVTCRYDIHSQACLHYSSVMSRQTSLSSMTCIDNREAGGNIREVKNGYATDHHKDWYSGWMRSKFVECERDEWPPAGIWQGRNKNVWIRFSPHTGNNLAGKLLIGACSDRVYTSTLANSRFLTKIGV